MSFRFVPNPRFVDELRRSPEFRRFALNKATDAADNAAGHVPRGFMERGKKPRAQASPDGAQVVWEGPGWHLAEYGTPTTPPHAPLRKGIEAAGMKFVPS